PSCQDEEPDGSVPHEGIEAEQEGRVRQSQHEPGLGDLLHPGPRVREQVPEPEDREVARTKGPKGAGVLAGCWKTVHARTMLPRGSTIAIALESSPIARRCRAILSERACSAGRPEGAAGKHAVRAGRYG